MNINENIRKLRDTLRLSQAQFAKKIDRTPSYISQLETGVSSPTVDVLQKISTAFGITIGSLFNETESSDMVSIPYYESVCASAGHGATNDNESIIPVTLSKDFLRDNFGLQVSKGLSIIRCSGNSMYPVLEEGTYLLIQDYMIDASISDGAIYVCCLGEDTYVKRLARNPAKKSIKLISENKDYDIIEIMEATETSFRVIGKVVGSIKRI